MNKRHPLSLTRPDFRLLETRLIWVQDRVLEESRKTNAITVEDIPVWLVRQGRLVVGAGGERIRAGAGQWMFPRQGQGWVHTMPGSRILSFRFRLRWPNGREVYRRRSTLVLDAKKAPELTRAANAILRALGGRHLWFEEQWEPASCAEFFTLQGHFHRWLAAYGSIMEEHGGLDVGLDEKDAPAMEARRALLEWDLAKPFSRKLLSRRLGAGIQTVTRSFAACYGATPREFLEQRKLQWAQQRLAQSGERIKVIAAELGFSSLAQFSNWFRLRNQASPRAYRDFARERGG